MSSPGIISVCRWRPSLMILLLPSQLFWRETTGYVTLASMSTRRKVLSKQILCWIPASPYNHNGIIAIAITLATSSNIVGWYTAISNCALQLLTQRLRSSYYYFHTCEGGELWPTQCPRFQTHESRAWLGQIGLMSPHHWSTHHLHAGRAIDCSWECSPYSESVWPCMPQSKFR